MNVVETEHLREYIVFSQTLNYAKAAETLFLSQPTLRAHIRALEEECGASFTVKRSNELILSPAGKFFLKRAREIFKLADETAESCREIAEESASILIGFLEYPYLEDMFIKAREELNEAQQTGLELLFSPRMHANVEAITQQEADVTIYPYTRDYVKRDRVNVPLLPSSVSSIYLGEKECRFWMTKSNPLFEQERISAADLAGSTLLLGNTQNMLSAGPKFQEYFAASGAEIDVDNQPFSSYADYFLTDSRSCFGIILEGHRFESQARKDFRIFTVDDVSVYSDLFLLYDESRLNHVGLELLQKIKELHGVATS